MDKNSRILVAGSETLAGRALSACMESKGYIPVKIQTEQLTDLQSTLQIFQKGKPEYVFLTAGKSGGIQINQKYPATLMRNNLLAELQVMEAARIQGVGKLLFLASSCIYPKNAPQPMNPSDLMNSPLELTSQSYALAKLSGIELCRAYRQEFGFSCISVIPSDSFGPESSFDAENAHVAASLIVKMHHAKKDRLPSITLWGSGNPVRDFIFSRDLAEGCLFLMEYYQGTEPINLTANNPLSIRGLAEAVCEAVGYGGDILFDTQFSDGAPSKILDGEKLRSLGWKPAVSFLDALRQTYEAYLKREAGDMIHA